MNLYSIMTFGIVRKLHFAWRQPTQFFDGAARPPLRMEKASTAIVSIEPNNSPTSDRPMPSPIHSS